MGSDEIWWEVMGSEMGNKKSKVLEEQNSDSKNIYDTFEKFVLIEPWTDFSFVFYGETSLWLLGFDFLNYEYCNWGFFD